MATEVDKGLFDAFIHQQIAIGRYANQQVQDIVGLLNAADREIIAKIIQRGEDGTFTTSRLNALLKEIRQMVDDTYWQAEKQLHEEMGGFALHSMDSTVDLLSAQMPVKSAAVAMTKEQLSAIVDRTPIAIGKDKRLLLEEIFSKLADGKEEAIRGAIRLGMVEGEGVPEIVRRLRGTKAAQYQDGILEVGRRDAASIVRTVVQSVNNSAMQATYANNKDVVKKWSYVSALDGKVCSNCWTKAGMEFDLGTGPLPPIHLNCRCVGVPVLATFKELGFDLEEMPAAGRSSKSGVVSSDISFHDWLKDETKATQVELLGAKRAELFRAGGLKLDRFTDASGELYTLAQLKERNSAAFTKAFGS